MPLIGASATSEHRSVGQQLRLLDEELPQLVWVAGPGSSWEPTGGHGVGWIDEENRREEIMSGAPELASRDHGFELYHLSPAIGTEVHGIDLSHHLDDETVAWLYQLLVARKVIFFRDQPITQDQHIAFARRFGDLEVHPFTANDAEHPEIIHLDNNRDRPPRINVWHSDVTWRIEPSLGSILRAVDVPEVGGDTLFANMEAAYDKLDEQTRARLDEMVAVHDNEVFLNGMRARGTSEEEIEAQRRKYPPTKHPVIRTHPETGRKAIYVNRIFTRTIDGMPDHDAQDLLEELYRTASDPDIQCRFRWRKDSFAFWDNRSAQHFAAADYWPHTRRMERVTIVGDRPR
jgi:taurine dioxygenase